MAGVAVTMEMGVVLAQLVPGGLAPSHWVGDFSGPGHLPVLLLTLGPCEHAESALGGDSGEEAEWSLSSGAPPD